jgi:hypothetical protein
MIHSSAPYVAGLQEGQALRPVPLHDFVVRARQLEDPVCRLVSCDKALVLLTAVHFTKRPDLGGSLKLINPAHVLRILAKEERDAAVALEHDGARTLLFLHRGRPARLFFGDPAEDPGEGSLEERLLLWAFDRVADTRVEIFSDLHVAPDPDAGCSFVRLADEAQPSPPATVFVSMDDREIRRRPFTPPEMIIGRDPRVDIFIDNLGVSGRHARLCGIAAGSCLPTSAVQMARRSTAAESTAPLSTRRTRSGSASFCCGLRWRNRSHGFPKRI